MHELGRPNHGSAVDLANGLVAQTDPEDRNQAREPTDGGFAYPGIDGSTRTGGDEDSVGLHGCEFVQGHLIVADDDRVSPKLAQVLNQDVDERVVVVDH